MGFNPFRDSKRNNADIAMLIIGLIAAFAVLAWAIFSG
jgi:hypothetical protein